MTKTELDKIKTIAFDFGGTLDAPGMHWFDYFWSFFEGEFSDGQKITKEQYWDAYVFAEREMDRVGVSENLSLFSTLRTKLTYQLEFLNKNGYARFGEVDVKDISNLFGFTIYSEVHSNLDRAKMLIEQLGDKYQVYIVSNYYGNLKKILVDENMGLYRHIVEVFDSTEVGIRKPDPAIWKEALDHSMGKPEEFLVVGDSMKNDILPAQSLGCPTVLINKQLPPDEYTGEWVNSLEMLAKLLNVRL